MPPNPPYTQDTQPPDLSCTFGAATACGRVSGANIIMYCLYRLYRRLMYVPGNSHRPQPEQLAELQQCLAHRGVGGIEDDTVPGLRGGGGEEGREE